MALFIDPTTQRVVLYKKRSASPAPTSTPGVQIEPTLLPSPMDWGVFTIQALYLGLEEEYDSYYWDGPELSLSDLLTTEGYTGTGLYSKSNGVALGLSSLKEIGLLRWSDEEWTWVPIAEPTFYRNGYATTAASIGERLRDAAKTAQDALAAFEADPTSQFAAIDV